MLASALALAEERGYESLRIADITDPVGVQRQAFYAHFRDKRHCLCEAISPRLRTVLELASAEEEDAPRWAEHVIAAIDETLEERFHSPDGTRGRLVATTIERLRETESFDAIRVGKLIKRAQVPTGDFYKQFSGKRECFAVAYEEMLEGLLAETRAASAPSAAGGSAEPRHEVPVLLESLGAALASDPVRLRLLVTQASHLSGSPGLEAGAWRGSFGDGISALLSQERGPGASSVLAASLLEVIRSSIVNDSIDALPARLAEIAAAPGLGGPAAPIAPLAA